MRRLVLLLVLVCCPGLGGEAWAQEAWMQLVIGPYDGPVMSSGRIEQLSTSFQLDEAGQLVGHYHVDDLPPYDGELTDFKPDGERQGSFVWHDRYGEGVVHIRFDPDRGRFLGLWGDDAPAPNNVFDGYRVRPPAVS